MPRKTISRVPATPRLIREIKPKRQLPRKSSTQEIAEGGDDWWSQSSHGGIETSPLAAAPLATNGVGTRSRFSREETHENFNQDEPKNHNRGLKHSLRERWERFKRTPFRKKMRQIFWSVILFHSLKIIYTADLEHENWQIQLPLEHDNYYPVNAKPMGKSFFTKEDMGQTSLFSPLSSAESNTSRNSALHADLRSISSDFYGPSSGNAGKNDLMYGSSNNENKHRLSNSISVKTYSNSRSQQQLSFGSLDDPLGNLLPQPKSLSATGMRDSSEPDALEKSYADAQSLQRLYTGNSVDVGGKSAITDSFVKTKSFGSSGRIDSFASGVFPKSPGYSSPQIKSFGAAVDRLGSTGDGGNSFAQSKSFGAASSLMSPGLDPLTYSDGSSESHHLSVLAGKPAQTIGVRGSLVSSSEAILPKSSASDTESASSGAFNYGLSPIKHSHETHSFTSVLPMGERPNRETSKLDSRLGVAGRNKLPSTNTELEGVETGHSNKKQQSAADLNCELHGGPHENEYSELIYWRDIPSDASFTSPYYSPKSQEQSHRESNTFWKTKYLTFEMDSSGWNNMRLGLENVMILAHAMGRTLVMPPKRQLAHGLRDDKGRKVVSFSDFYDITAIDAEQSGLNIITMEQFLEREAMNGNLKGQYPPDNRIKWDNQHLHPLWAYISNVTEVFDWQPNECILTILGDGSDEQNLLIMMDDILDGKDGRPFPHPSEYQGKPTRVDAPTVERLREVLAGRKKMCIYNKHMHSAHDVVHFKADETDGTRLITQFYAFLWFEDWKQDLWAKRFVRDHLRYRDEIMCLAARIVTAIRAHARQRDPSNVKGDYDAMHVRRTDFSSQFPDTALSASEILSQIQQNVDTGSTLFIATDEHNRTFFRDIEAVYDVKYLGDFSSEISSINPNFFGLVEQIVASRSRVFIGTYYSSFSAYIVRLRGYYSVKEHRDGYKSGGLRDTYYVPAKYKNVMRMYQAIHPPFYAQDFPSAWRDIDHLDHL